MRGVGFPGGGCRAVRRDGFAHHGRRLRRLHDQPGEGRALRQLHRHGQGEVQRQVRPRTQGLRGGDLRRFAPAGVIRIVVVKESRAFRPSPGFLFIGQKRV